MEILQTVNALLSSLACWLKTENWGIWATALLMVHFLFHWHDRRKQKKEKKRRIQAEITRREQFVLPDRDNSFVCARLHTALQDANLPKLQENDGVKREDFRFDYVRKLLTRLKNAPLSTAERLQAEDMEKTLGFCLQKERLQTEDIRLVNDTFSAVLKLAAKYAV